METEHKTEEIVDLKSFKNIFKSDKLLKFLPVALIIIALFFSVFFRMTPSYLPLMDKFAEDSIENSLKNQIASEILKESPNLPPDTLSREVDRRLQIELQANKDQVRASVAQLANNFREKLKDDDGQTYLLAIDPYTYYRRAGNILKNGHVGDTLVNGAPYNTHMEAPIGKFDRASFHPYFEAYLYKALAPITGKSLMGIAALVPVIISALAVIPAFYLGRRMSGNVGGFAAAFVVAVHSAFVSRTAYGFADTDAYNVTFPLFITWLFFLSLEAKDIKKRIIYGSLAGFLIGLFAFTWVGWWYIFDFLLGAAVVYLAYNIIVNLKEHKKHVFKQPVIKNSLIVLLVFLVSSCLFTSIFVGFHSFFKAPIAPLSFIALKSVATESVWPNVYTTVAEQNAVPFPSVVSTMGGKILFYLALMGLMFAIFKRGMKLDKIDYIILGTSALWFIFALKFIPNNLAFLVILALPGVAYLILNLARGKKDLDIISFILLGMWFMATLYAARQGIR
ncbi:hypothetical protein KY311_02440, partial [Candidatus Woesearchaeota archaeon]|nr:hypothetical protein [Candidatus Woesearchaeota archaeon]